MSELIFETDWVGSEPVYYNEATGTASRNPNEVIDFAEVEFDGEGLNSYLGTGYCPFWRTPVRHVHVMPAMSRLWREDDGLLRVEETTPRVEDFIGERCSEDAIIELLMNRVRRTEALAEADLVIPTSGGLDSRLLNLMVADSRRIRSFTFVPSARQWDSAEVARARALAMMLGSQWERIPIGQFHDYLDEWDDAFGPVVHAHGMYQMEFYRQVRRAVRSRSVVLSGLGGDWLEGKGDGLVKQVVQPSDVHHLILVGGQHADVAASRVPSTGELSEEYLASKRAMLASDIGRIVEAMRFRVRLTHYLLRVPRLYSLEVDAPFLDPDVAGSMLALPPERRSDRRWLLDYLASRDALLEKAGGTTEYWLYWPALRRRPLAPLDARLLAEIVRPEYVRWINRSVGPLGLWQEGYARLSSQRGFRRATARLRRAGAYPRRLEAYHAYMTLRPLQRLILKRDAARRAIAQGGTREGV